jgi:lipopolysaccharide export system permease protein
VKRIDSVILREIIGPWCFGVAMFSVVIFAGNFLFQLSQFMVQGAGVMRVVELTILFLPSVIIKTFPMAILLAALLAFGRLSSDSEIVAMRAAGVSIRRMMYPVAVFSIGIAIVSFALNEIIVPPATMQALTLQSQIAADLKSSGDQPLAFALKDNQGNVTALVAAADFDLASKSLQNVTITALDKTGEPSFYLHAPLFQYTGGTKNWKIIGGGRLVAADGGYSATLKGDTWPPEVPDITLTPQDLLRQNLKTLDAFSLSQMREQITDAKTDPHTSRKQLVNLQYGFWNKFALPLAALVYGLLGAPLGIRNVRTGAATGFAVSVAIIFAYITLANLMNVYAMGGAIPAYLASFTPLVIGLIAAGVIIWRRNG